MNHRRIILAIEMSTSLVFLLAGLWWSSSHLLTLNRFERFVGLVVVAVGGYAVAMQAIRRLEAWRDRRGRVFRVRSAQPMEIMNVRCEVCDCDEFLEGPHGGLCTNIKCVQCSAEYNYGPGIMERIRR